MTIDLSGNRIKKLVRQLVSNDLIEPILKRYKEIACHFSKHIEKCSAQEARLPSDDLASWHLDVGTHLRAVRQTARAGEGDTRLDS